MRCVTAAVLAISLAGCDLAPPYDPPHYILPASYGGAKPWQVAHPADRIPKGAWWTVFGNPVLDGLEARLPANPNLLAAREAYVQSRELAAEARSGLYPQVSLNGLASQNHQSVHRLFRSPTSQAPLTEPSVQADATADWEIDLWDRIGNETAARERLAQAQAADLASVELSLEATLASTYVTLRTLDQQAALYRKTIAVYQTALHITQLRLGDDIGNAIDVARAQTQLSSTQAAAAANAAQRALALHAIAVLVGEPASTFTLPPQDGTPLKLPQVPTGLPAELLQRRPDIAAAERSMAAANAEIGVARAAFFPNISLSGLAGTADTGFNLVSLPNAVWSIGSQIALPLFEGGLRKAELDFAKSSYAQTRDNYRALVLDAFADVEDQLSLTDLLAQQAAADRQAAAAADKAQSLSMQLYTAGLGNFLDVVVAQVAALQASTTSIGLDATVQQATVNLVRALGGGWSAADLPTERETLPFNPLVPGGDP